MHQADQIDSAPTELQLWEAEGGATDAPLAPMARRAAREETVLLAWLGKALVGEWHNLTTLLQRAVYDRAATYGAGSGSHGARRRLARYLHDHRDRPARG
jgi:hypothetical protein